MLIYTRGKPGKLSIVISNASSEEVALCRQALGAITSTKFFVYEGEKSL